MAYWKIAHLIGGDWARPRPTASQPQSRGRASSGYCVSSIAYLTAYDRGAHTHSSSRTSARQWRRSCGLAVVCARQQCSARCRARRVRPLSANCAAASSDMRRPWRTARAHAHKAQQSRLRRTTDRSREGREGRLVASARGHTRSIGDGRHKVSASASRRASRRRRWRATSNLKGDATADV